MSELMESVIDRLNAIVTASAGNMDWAEDHHKRVMDAVGDRTKGNATELLLLNALHLLDRLSAVAKLHANIANGLFMDLVEVVDAGDLGVVEEKEDGIQNYIVHLMTDPVVLRMMDVIEKKHLAVIGNDGTVH